MHITKRKPRNRRVDSKTKAHVGPPHRPGPHRPPTRPEEVSAAPLTGPQFQLAREMIVEGMRDVTRGLGGLCVVCGVRPSTVTFAIVLTDEERRKLGTTQRKETFACVGACAPCSRRPDLEEKADAFLKEMIERPGAAPVYDFGDLHVPIEFGPFEHEKTA